MPKGLPDAKGKVIVEADTSGYNAMRDSAKEARDAAKDLSETLRKLGGDYADLQRRLGEGYGLLRSPFGNPEDIKELLSSFYEAKAQQVQYAMGQQEIAAAARAQAQEQIALQKEVAQAKAQVIAVDRATMREQMAMEREAAQIKSQVIAEQKQQREDITKVAIAMADVQKKAAADQIAREQALQAEIQKTGLAYDKAVISYSNAVKAYGRQSKVAGGAIANEVASGVLTEARTAGNYNDAADIILAAASMRNTAGGKASASTGQVLSALQDIRGSSIADMSNRLSGIEAGLIGMLAGRGAAGGGAGGNISDAAVQAVIDRGLAAALGGGGSSGGGGIGKFFSAGFGGLGKSPRADAQWDSVATFLATWYPRFHWAMMLTNEILATAGPALVAGGAAAAVGLEGGQTAAQRLNAVNAVGQSLGPSLGQTPGQFLGVGDALQLAQTKADPGVWELLGAVKNSINAASKQGGGLGNFWQLGTNTLAMFDRFGAEITQDFKAGSGKQINALVQGGTQDLQQFGDVLGNVGKTFLNVAPSLPGVGSDLLSTLQFATKGLSVGTGLLGDAGLLGPILALEAGSRYGPALVGGVGALTGRIGTGLSAAGATGIGGILGTQGRLATAQDVAYAAANGLPAIEEGDRIEGTGIAGVLGGMGPLQVGGAAAAAYLLAKGYGYKTPEQQSIGTMQATAGQDYFSQAGNDLMTNMAQLSATAAQVAPGFFSQGTSAYRQFGDTISKGNIPGAINSLIHILSDTPAVSSQAAAQSALQQQGGQFDNLLNAGQEIAKRFGTDVPNAFMLADQAQLQMSTAFNKNGTLSATAIQQIENMQAGYKMMASSTGTYAKNVGAVQTAEGLSGTQLATVNNDWDQIVSNSASGTSGATGFASSLATFQALGSTLSAANAAAEVARLKPAAAKKSTAATAQALTGFTSAASQAAWNAFSSTSTTTPGMIEQVNSMLDSLRTAQTSGVLTQGDTTAAAMYQAKQLLPYASKSAAAQAQLSVLAQETGYGGLPTTGTSAKDVAENYKSLSSYIDKNAASTEKYNAVLQKQAIGMSDVSATAANFGDTLQSNVYGALAQGAVNLPKMSNDMKGFMSSVTSSGQVGASPLKSLAQDLSSVKASAGDVGAILGAALSGKGLSTSAISNVVGKVKAEMNSLDGKSVKVKASADDAEVKKLQNEISALKGKDVAIRALGNASQVAAFQAQVNALQGKIITITTVYNYVYHYSGMGTLPTPTGQASFVQAVTHPAGHAQGFLVPGFGGGDTVPAMLEPGEAVIPKYLVHQLIPFLRLHGVPGFAAGGVVPGGTLSAIDAQISTAWTSLDQLYSRENAATGNALASLKTQIADFWSATLDPLYAAKDRLDGKTPATSSAAAADPAVSKAASSIAAAFQTEMNFARSTAAAALTGQGFGTQGLISGWTAGTAAGLGSPAPPGSKGYNAAAWNAYNANYASDTAPAQTVQQQMQSYLGSEQSFAKDLKSLSKEGLSKGIISQLIAAGPVQGDSLAQSIMSTGVGGINKLWSQIGKASNSLGAQSAMSMYGGTIAPNLKSGSVTSNNISINISAPGGAGGDVSLTTTQVNEIVREVQAALLKQAKRNRKTNLSINGKSA